MRIIAGSFKGKKLFLPNNKKTRPLKDLVKESIFNLIEHSNKINANIYNKVILDLFSGSGSFGLECLSRGAKEVFFFENYPDAISILEQNIRSLKNVNNYKIFKSDCLEYFNSEKKINKKFDIIFVDPPYKDKNINNLLDKLISKKLLNKNGIIILHRHKKDKLRITEKLNIIEERFYGIAKISFGNGG